MQNWDDTRIFLAVARHGTSRAAARHLGLNQSTVSRRLGQLEEHARVTLFERLTTGLRLTEAGQATLVLAEQIEANFAALDRQVLGRDVSLSGQIRLSLPDFAVGPTSPILAAFSARYPDIELEVIVENGYVSLTRRQADIALRLAQRAPEHLVGRKIARVGVAVYGTPEYLARCEDPSDLARMDWVRWEEAFHGIPPERWFDANVPSARVRASVNTNLAMVELLAAGIGVAFQACYVGDADSRLCRVAQPAQFDLAIWLLTHEDLRKTARISAFMRFVGDALMAQRARIEGTSA